MIIHYLQHVPFEGLGSTEGWALSHGHADRATRLYTGEAPPSPEEFDCLTSWAGR